MATSGSLRRRQPVQQRSRDRVGRILAAALELLESGGSDAVTTRAIADRAGVPVATVYQFFPNRDAIIDEILQDLLERRAADGHAVLAAMNPSSIAEVVAELFDFHRCYLRDHPHMATLFYVNRASGALTDPRLLRSEVADAVHHALIAWGLLPADTDPLVAAMAIELGDHILELAHRRGAGLDLAVLAEGERVVTAYLETYVVPQG
ncbi:TetR/AcrR family transcriptional regulator [Mycobacterium sp. PDNC021]|uniref:TetR/AcrR family transcriptional regulator n=1 Tax=Mycobacterium sp. PDNC021 TaxID=3391399 RepID=UPI003AAA2031